MVQRVALQGASAFLLTTAFIFSATAHADDEASLDTLIRAHLTARGASAKLASSGALARRFSVDLTGIVPTVADLNATKDMTPTELFDYFTFKEETEATRWIRPFVWINLLRDADHFLFSNNTQFSQVAHIRTFERELATVYSSGRSYQDFARWALTSQMFLNRFPSAADRANAVFFLFLGRDSLASEVASGNMWNGYRLKNASILPADAERNPEYHVYVFDSAVCDEGLLLCSAELWSQSGSRPHEAIEIIVGSPMFAETIVDRYWFRYIGAPLPGLDFPEIRRMLARGLVANEFNVNWLIHEIMTSSAYTQEAMFR